MDILLIEYFTYIDNYHNFFICENKENFINIKIIDLKNIEYLYHGFIDDLYYFLRTKKVMNYLNINYEEIEIIKDTLTIVNNNNIIFRINVKIF